MNRCKRRGCGNRRMGDLEEQPTPPSRATRLYEAKARAMDAARPLPRSTRMGFPRHPRSTESAAQFSASTKGGAYHYFPNKHALPNGMLRGPRMDGPASAKPQARPGNHEGGATGAEEAAAYPSLLLRRDDRPLELLSSPSWRRNGVLPETARDSSPEATFTNRGAAGASCARASTTGQHSSNAGQKARRSSPCLGAIHWVPNGSAMTGLVEAASSSLPAFWTEPPLDRIAEQPCRRAGR